MAIRNIATLLYLFLSHLASSQGSNATLSITTEVDQPFSQTTLTTPTSWQYGLSLAECNKYMLDHQLDTDIVFRVGSRRQAPSLIRAHRYVLMSRSDVFTQLLRQNNSDNNSMLRAGRHSMQTIDIPDMDPDVFRELINYVYTGNATVNLDNAIPLIYAAKRFQQPNLSKLCLEMLQRSISIENVYLILSKALYLKEKPLINKTLEFIGLKAEQVLNSDEVLNLSREIFTLVISYDGLDTNETLIFETSMRWVKAQMSKNNLITSLEIDKIEIARRVFGDLIYRIRFPIMDPKECAELVGASDLLTCEEKYSIFRYISTSDHMNYTLKFDHEKRVRTRFIDRFDNSFERNHGSYYKEPKIQFNVSKSIILKAVGTYGFTNFYFSDRLPMNNTVTVTLSRSSQKYLQRRHSEQIMVEVQNYTWTRTRELKKDHIFKIPIPGDVRLEPNAFYTIAIEIIPGPNDPHYGRDQYYFTGFGSNSRGASINDSDVVFTFDDNIPNHQIYGHQSHGQIPRLYYY